MEKTALFAKASLKLLETTVWHYITTKRERWKPPVTDWCLSRQHAKGTSPLSVNWTEHETNVSVLKEIGTERHKEAKTWQDIEWKTKSMLDWRHQRLNVEDKGGVHGDGGNIREYWCKCPCSQISSNEDGKKQVSKIKYKGYSTSPSNQDCLFSLFD